ncbi:hypothetical protein Emed_007201 [Eimeria media]
MEPLIGGPTSPFRSHNTPLPPDSQQPRELSDFSFYKSVNAADCKALQSTYRRGKRSAEASKLKSLQTQDTFKRDALRTIIRCLSSAAAAVAAVAAAVGAAAVAAAVAVGAAAVVAAAVGSERRWLAFGVSCWGFLTFSEFPGPLSAKALSSPQRSLLIDIWSHLFRRCFDDSVKLTAENVNDEVPRLFKEIGVDWGVRTAERAKEQQQHQQQQHQQQQHQQQQQQTSEVYAQWPHHLAALSWLCELLIYENEFFYQEEEAAELQGRSDLVGRLMAAAYAQSGKDVHAVKASVLGQLHALNGEAEAAHQQLQQQLQQRQQQLASVEAELRDNASLMVSSSSRNSGNSSNSSSSNGSSSNGSSSSSNRSNCSSNSTSSSHTSSSSSSNSSSCCGESRAATAAAERDSLLQQQKELQREVNQLEERIKAQGIDKAELERIRHDIARLREGLVHRTKEIEGLSEALQTLIDQLLLLLLLLLQVADDSEKLRIAGHSVSLHEAREATAAAAPANVLVAAIVAVAAVADGVVAAAVYVAVAAATIASAVAAVASATTAIAVSVAAAATVAPAVAAAAGVAFAATAAAAASNWGLAISVNESISSIIQLAASAKLQTVEAWASLPKLETFAAAAADNAAAAAVAAAAASCDIKRATNEILGVDWPALKTEMLRLMKLEEQAEAETNQQRQRAEKEIERLKKAIKDLIASRKTLEKRMQLVQEDLQQQQQQQQAELQQLEEAERQHLAGVREAKQQQQQEQQQLQRRVQQQQQLLQQEDRQQQQEAASAIAALQQQQREALQQKRQLLQQLQLLTETKHAECCAVEQQLLELREALTPSPKAQQQHRVSSV